MDRSLSSTSVDNALDSLIMKATRFPRSDSEDQFRKFLERIPSTTNLASYSGSMQSLPQIQQQGLQLVSSGAPLSAHLPEGGSLNVGGIPRVPSLDLLRQLVAQQQHHGQNGSAKQSNMQVTVKDEPSGPGPASSPGSEAALAETSLSGLPAASALSLPLPVTSFPQSGGSSSQVTTVMPTAPALMTAPSQPKEPRSRDSKAEIRRARRMLSNRESARRSRRRKQEHLGLLEEQIQQLEEERDALMQQVEKLEKQAHTHVDQNVALRKENEELRQQLGIEGKDRKAGSHPNKKQCQGLNQ